MDPGRPKLVALDGRADPDVVARLEILLAQAQAGRLRGVVILASGCGDVVTAWAGAVDFPSAVGAFEIWKHRFLHAGVDDPLPDGPDTEDLEG